MSGHVKSFIVYKAKPHEDQLHDEGKVRVERGMIWAGIGDKICVEVVLKLWIVSWFMRY